VSGSVDDGWGSSSVHPCEFEVREDGVWGVDVTGGVDVNRDVDVLGVDVREEEEEEDGGGVGGDQTRRRRRGRSK
jgi:hypothetical protein